MDSRPLSYDVMQSIIGHMDLFKRVALTEIPMLKTAERNADLYLDVLRIDQTSITLEGDKFMAVKPQEVFRPDDNNGSRIFRLGDHPFRSKTKEKEPAELLKKVADYYLANRGTVKVRRLEVAVPIENGKLPEGLKMDCQELKLRTGHQSSNIEKIESVAPFLTNRPLETVIINVNGADAATIFENNLIRKARCLKISTRSPLTLRALLKMENSKIQLKNSDFTTNDFVSVAENWLCRCPPIGTQFDLDRPDEELIDGVKTALSYRFAAVSGEILDTDSKDPIPCVTIKMESGDELNVFEVRADQYGSRRMLRMEVMQRETSRIVVYRH